MREIMPAVLDGSGLYPFYPAVHFKELLIMQVQLLVERDQSTCVVKLDGYAYTFKRNKYGHLVSNIDNEDHLRWVADPSHNTSFRIYAEPKVPVAKGYDEVVADEVVADDGEQGEDEIVDFPTETVVVSKRKARRR